MSQEAQDRVDPILKYVRELNPGREVHPSKAVSIRLRRAAHYIETETRRYLAPAGIESWELEILALLMRHGGALTVGQLQGSAQLTSGAMTNRISQLDRDGYVTRTIDVRDRRQIVVALTETGRQRTLAVLAANDAAEHAIFQAIDPRLLSRLADDLRTFLLLTEGPEPDAESRTNNA